MRQKMAKVTALLCFFSLLLSSCASIVSHSNYPMYLHSTPAGVNVSITDENGQNIFSGQTPTTVTLKSGSGYFKKAKYQVKFSALGYAEQNIPVSYKMNGWYWGNLLLGGVVGMLIVDPLTGAMWKPRDPMVDATMVKSGNTALATPSLEIIDVNSLSATAKTNLVRIK